MAGHALFLIGCICSCSVRKIATWRSDERPREKKGQPKRLSVAKAERPQAACAFK